MPARFEIAALTNGSPPARIAAAQELLVRFFAEERFEIAAERIAARVAQMLGLDICRILVGVIEDRGVAVATVSLDFGIEFGWSAEIGDLYVAEPWRGQGIAHALISAACEWARSRGAGTVRVTVTDWGEAHRGLMAFYRRLGFRDDGRRTPYRNL
jgi:GNAT superfamily N-acetyltransferase